MTEPLKAIDGVSILGAHDGTMPDAIYDAMTEPAQYADTVAHLRAENQRLRNELDDERCEQLNLFGWIIGELPPDYDLHLSEQETPEAYWENFRSAIRALKGPTP